MSIASRYQHVLTVKRMVPSAGTAAETVGGADTTLTADITVGALTASVTSAVGIAIGDFLRIGDTGETEIREVSLVAVLVVTFTAPFTLNHDTGDTVREVDDAGTNAEDDYGQPETSSATLATVPGLVQPRTIREMALASQAGAVIGNHVGYMDLLAGLSTDCWIEVDYYPGIRFDVKTMPDPAGLGHHLELGLQSVT